MKGISQEAEQILMERFGHDGIIALATCTDNIPHVRSVDAYYDDGAFYVLTHGLSGKMRQIGENPVVAVSGEWFTAHGRAVNLGWFGKKENGAVARKMKTVFAAWIDNGHNNFEDRNTCILRIDLTDGVLFSRGTRYELDFRNKASVPDTDR